MDPEAADKFKLFEITGNITVPVIAVHAIHVPFFPLSCIFGHFECQ
jgi:hypothetical protein